MMFCFQNSHFCPPQLKHHILPTLSYWSSGLLGINIFWAFKSDKNNPQFLSARTEPVISSNVRVTLISASPEYKCYLTLKTAHEACLTSCNLAKRYIGKHHLDRRTLDAYKKPLKIALESFKGIGFCNFALSIYTTLLHVLTSW